MFSGTLPIIRHTGYIRSRGKASRTSKRGNIQQDEYDRRNNPEIPEGTYL